MNTGIVVWALIGVVKSEEFYKTYLCLAFFLNRAVNRPVPWCVVLGRADKRCLVFLFSYHVSNVDGKQDFLLLCHSLSYPFCLDTAFRVRYF
jgi:hypothetical protein